MPGANSISHLTSSTGELHLNDGGSWRPSFHEMAFTWGRAMIEATCRCGKRILASEAVAGEEGQCSLCRRLLRLPALQTVGGPASSLQEAPLIPLGAPESRESGPPAPEAVAAGQQLAPRSAQDYVYWVLLLALFPLVLALFQHEESSI